MDIQKKQSKENIEHKFDTSKQLKILQNTLFLSVSLLVAPVVEPASKNQIVRNLDTSIPLSNNNTSNINSSIKRVSEIPRASDTKILEISDKKVKESILILPNISPLLFIPHYLILIPIFSYLEYSRVEYSGYVNFLKTFHTIGDNSKIEFYESYMKVYKECVFMDKSRTISNPLYDSVGVYYDFFHVGLLCDFHSCHVQNNITHVILLLFRYVDSPLKAMNVRIHALFELFFLKYHGIFILLSISLI